ncbi:hypothetical protein JYG23_04595 [Sedimentibacter sp. zth1]|uniref:hypothetical protein n=1 Tax=Sedimentibacter sp. zth1 TaxID=2816908 RepID=UPI001A938E42|nr:hypothetical protein [Sedimentibacter sp. zth1]QSX06729.1 hypothetical protein JYG23_04595 [Sedimentibacter sp. zth1]
MNSNNWFVKTKAHVKAISIVWKNRLNYATNSYLSAINPSDREVAKIALDMSLEYVGGEMLGGLINSTGCLFKGTGKTADDIYSFQKYKQTLIADDVLSNSDVIIDGGKLWDKKAIEALTSDGSSIDDWVKMSSKYSYDTPYGRGQYHYYKNLKTGEIHPFDAKLKLNKPPHNVIPTDSNFNPIN